MDQFTVSARVTASPGRETVTAQRLQGVNPVDVWVRWSSQTATIQTEWRAVDARDPKRVFAILSVTDPEQIAPRSVAMWRARTIMKVTPWRNGTLFLAVQTAIAGLTNPLQRAAAEEALERGDVFDRDGVFVPMLAGGLGLTNSQLDDLMAQAAALPA